VENTLKFGKIQWLFHLLNAGIFAILHHVGTDIIELHGDNLRATTLLRVLLGRKQMDGRFYGKRGHKQNSQMPLIWMEIHTPGGRNQRGVLIAYPHPLYVNGTLSSANEMNKRPFIY
jgi:hypothetical protein